MCALGVMAGSARAHAQQASPSATAGTTARASTGAAGATTQKPFEATFDASALFDRPHTIAEIELGMLALPDAPISTANEGGNLPELGKFGKGDATMQIGLHILYRATRDWAIGAIGTFAPKPTSDTNYQPTIGIGRTHSRSYMFL